MKLLLGFPKVSVAPSRVRSRKIAAKYNRPAAAAAPPVAAPAVVTPGAVVPAAAPSRKGPALIFAGVGLIVLLLIAGVGGYFVMHTMINKPETNTTATAPPSNPAGSDLAGA